MPVRQKKVILCVDDNELSLSVRKFMLQTKGYKVLTASGGEQAIAIFREGGIELLLTDLVMPLMDGNELVRKIKAINPEIPTVIFSGVVKSYDRATHANAFLPKGACSPVELLERVRVMTVRKRGPKKHPKTALPILAAEQVPA
jgi:two-component system, OmpR family, response regulator CpxR